jgi:hypothetical protein
VAIAKERIRTDDNGIRLPFRVSEGRVNLTLVADFDQLQLPTQRPQPAAAKGQELTPR